MNTKLTLSLDKKIIDRAKAYAKEHQVSLSFLIENYLQKLISDDQFDDSSRGSLVEELSGIISLDEATDYQEDHIRYLNEKHK